MAFRLCNKDRMLKPGKCLICETHPGHRVVDTGYNLTAATVFDKLRGRKYICSGCGEKIGKALGMITQVQVNAMKTEIDRLTAHAARLEESLAMQDRLDQLTEYLRRDDAASVENESAASPGGD